MASTSSASAKHGERNAKHATAHGAGVRLSSYNYKLHKDSAELAKRSQKLLCSPAVDLRHDEGGSTKRRSMLRLQDLPRMLNAAIRTARSFTGQVRRNRLLSLSGWDRRHAQRRTATSMPKTALPHFLVETVDIAAADPGLFHAFGRLDRGGVLLGDADATNVQMAGHHFSQVHLVTSSRRCVQHAQCRRIADWHSCNRPPHARATRRVG